MDSKWPNQPTLFFFFLNNFFYLKKKKKKKKKQPAPGMPNIASTAISIIFSVVYQQMISYPPTPFSLIFPQL